MHLAFSKVCKQCLKSILGPLIVGFTLCLLDIYTTKIQSFRHGSLFEKEPVTPNRRASLVPEIFQDLVKSARKTLFPVFDHETEATPEHEKME